MTPPIATPSSHDVSTSQRWAYVPVLLLAFMVSGLLILARIASNDPGFAVERDYYRKAVAWDQEMAQRATNERLGYRAELDLVSAPAGKTRVSLSLADRNGSPVSAELVTLQAFHVARSADVLEATLKRGSGTYQAELPMHRAGVWEFRVRADVKGERFTSVLREELAR